MRTRFVIEPAADSRVSVNELQDLFVLLMDQPPEDDAEDIWRQRLPAWLTQEFVPTRTMAEKHEWLAGWRRASQQDRVRMEHESGWELPEWLHWFSDENEVWSIAEVQCADGKLTIMVDHEDDPFPKSVLEWTVETAGLEVGSEERIS